MAKKDKPALAGKEGARASGKRSAEESLILSGDRYESFIDECRGTITEAVFNSRWELIKGHHELGRLIREHFTDSTGLTGEVVTKISGDIGVSRRTLFYAMKFYDKFPNIDSLPDGKNISWNKIVQHHLTDGSEKEAKPELPELDPITVFQSQMADDNAFMGLHEAWESDIDKVIKKLAKGKIDEEEAKHSIVANSQEFFGKFIVLKKKKF